MQTEQKIIRGIIRGDEIILKAFYKRNYPAIKSYVQHNSGSLQDVDDIFQDAMIFLYQKLRSDTLILRASIHTYFYGICKNLWCGKLRRNSKEILVDTLIHEFDPGEVPIFQAMIEETERERLYRKYFSKLPKSTREIWYHFMEGKSAREIAIIMGYSEGYVRKKKYLSKKKVLDMIATDPIFKNLRQ